MADPSAEHAVLPFCRRWHIIDEVDLAPMAADHASMRRLCDELEAMADQLPEWADAGTRNSLADRLGTELARHHVTEGHFLSSVFAKERGSLAVTLVQHIMSRHVADSVHADDLIEVLRHDGPGDGPAATTLGYMLRCFFDNCRQAMDFEELAIVALASRRLTPGARAMLEESLSRSHGIT